VLTSFVSWERRTMAKRKRMSREEFEALARDTEALQGELLRIIERKEAAAKAREEKRLRRRRLFGLLPL
jgi:hypothetical protein